ncbi:MAG TPA: aminopeptidase [Candidatus Hydrogenedentes bacterium]|nr:aminopeptidase [Candidatus Hydrogenedentota bacterium]HIJ73752.1 aminopeptidase [Candidatus Hydrogenedentota bacterium]
MKDPRITRLAENLLGYSVKLEPGNRLLIESRGQYSLELVKELVRLATAQGAVPFWYVNDEHIERSFLLSVTEEQMNAFTEVHLKWTTEMDAYIAVRGSENAFELADVPEEQMRLYNQIYRKKVHLEHRIEHTKWCVLRWPNSAMAQLAETSQEAFEDFFFRVCNLDYARLSNAMDPLKALMEATDEVRITGPETDLTFSINGMNAIKCDGDRNIPDGELYTAPVRDSINGTIAYNTPAVHQGAVYDRVRFDFKDGKIVRATCNGDNAKLNRILDTDEGARYIGEFSLGLNPFIRKPMKDTLFDEKIYGSFHLTPGNCYDEAPNGNKSAIHWDLVQIQTPEYGGGEIYFDGRLIRKDGEFVPAEVAAVLNAAAF